MHRNPNSPGHLTEFVPHSDDVKPSGNFLTRLFRRSAGAQHPQADRDPFIPEQSECIEEDDEDEDQTSPDDVELESDTQSEASTSGPGSSLPVHPPPARTLSSVLNRLGRIVARRSQTPQAYKDSDFKQFWMPDSNCRECYECGSRFNTFRRRHHCRICGQIFCSQCCNQEVPGKIMGYTGFLRVCTYCCKVVLHYAQNPDEVSDELQSIDSRAQLHSTNTPSNVTATGPESSLSASTAVESPSRPNMTASVASSAARRSSKAHRLSSIFDEDVKQRPRATTDVDVSLLDSLHLECKAMLQDSARLQELWTLMKHATDGVDVNSQRQRLKTCTDCVAGSDVVDWLLSRGEATSRDQAVVVGQALMDGKWITSAVTQDSRFRDDHTLYRPVEMSLRDEPVELMSLPHASGPDSEDEDGPLWVKKIQQNTGSTDVLRSGDSSGTAHMSSCSGDLDATNSSVFYVDSPLFLGSLPRPKKGGEQTSTPVDESSHAEEANVFPASDACTTQLESDASLEGNMEIATREKHSKLHMEHLTKLLNQLLESHDLPSKWADTILSVTQKASRVVRPDVRNDSDDMDIRQYVTVKKVPGGLPSDTAIVNGAVCTKTVAHRKMRQEIQSPRILLLRSPIEYQRVENKFSSLEPQILQEHEYLRNCVSRIAALQPDIVLVEKTVSRLAQGFLLDAGITLIINVKPSVMERVARFTQATIVASIDGLVNRTTMGSCINFYMRSFVLDDGSSKCLMYFDGCATNLGCTITLRGGTRTELKAVKRIMRFMTYAMYNARLESSFLTDELAQPPTPDDPSNDDDIFDAMLMSPPSPIIDSFHAAVMGNKSACIASVSGEKHADGLDKNADDTSCSKQRDVVASTERQSRRNAADSIFRCSVPNEGIEAAPPKETKHKLQADRFRKALDETILSVTPFIRHLVPYLKTEAGSQCLLRCYFPSEVYWSNKFETVAGSSTEIDNVNEILSKPSDDAQAKSVVALLPLHPFLVEKLSVSANSHTIQGLLSDFRARGGRIPWSVTFPKDQKELANEEKSNGAQPCRTVPAIGSQQIPADCLDPFNHQRLLVLFSSFSYESANAPAPCVSPWVVTMDFYGRNDITLGGFLERYCFREAYRCSSRNCETPMSSHIRRFVHGMGCIQIIVKKIENSMPGSSDTIYMWSFCKKCREGTTVTTMSSDTWLLSFAKYLELRFRAGLYRRCPMTSADDQQQMAACSHSIHFDHYQYFGSQNVVVSVRYSAITLKEVTLPSIVIQILPAVLSLQQLEDNGTMLHFQTSAVTTAVLEQLHRLKKEAPTDLQSASITEQVLALENEAESVLQKIEYVQSLISDAKRLSHENKAYADHGLGLQISDAFVGIKHQVADLVTDWNARIHEFEVAMKKPVEKGKSASTANSSVMSTSSSRNSTAAGSLAAMVVVQDDKLSSGTEAKIVKEDEDQTFTAVSDAGQSCAGGASSSSTCYQLPEVIINSWSNNAENAFVEGPSGGEKMSESISSASSRGSPISDQVTSVLSRVDEVDTAMSGVQSGDSLKASARSRVPSDSKKPSKPAARETVAAGDQERRDRTGAVKQFMSSLLSGGGSTTVPIPFPGDEHHLLAPCQKVPIVVFDQEPSSIIAYALSSYEYEQSLQELRIQSVNGETSSSNSSAKRSQRSSEKLPAAADCDNDRQRGVLSFLKGSSVRDKSPSKRTAKFDVDSVKYTPQSSERDSLEDTDESVDAVPVTVTKQPVKQQQPINHHIDLQFADTTANFYCRVCFADEFCRLRQLIFPEGEERYIRSLSRCFTWLARGGKSGSTFCKTQDDRFILKQMSRYEVQSFNEFAPQYFKYITSAHADRKPTVLAKIVGVYKIGYQNSKTNAALKQDLLVMENLFYNRKVTQIFDLKGSARNRLVSTSGKRAEEVVLLDENLIKASTDSPLYIHPHSKAVLTSAISRDTLFLSSHLVMDYSLLVGIDESNNELLVGIIDYIRTFTWDKMLEMLLKKNFGGAAPTIVSPDHYRRRFLDSMDRYFMLVPDQWSGLGKGLE